MENERANKLVLSKEAQKLYLEKLSKRVIKILYLIEEEQETKFSPEGFILGQLFDVTAANPLFDNQLVDVIVKLNGLLKYAELPFATVRKQVFEIKGIVDYLFKNL